MYTPNKYMDVAAPLDSVKKKSYFSGVSLRSVGIISLLLEGNCF
jgi:hypothetical protein